MIKANIEYRGVYLDHQRFYDEPDGWCFVRKVWVVECDLPFCHRYTSKSGFEISTVILLQSGDFGQGYEIGDRLSEGWAKFYIVDIEVDQDETYMFCYLTKGAK